MSRSQDLAQAQAHSRKGTKLMQAEVVEEGQAGRDVQPPIRQGGVVVFDFGSQYTQLIARRVRELGVYSELLPHDAPVSEIERLQPGGLYPVGRTCQRIRRGSAPASGLCASRAASPCSVSATVCS